MKLYIKEVVSYGVFREGDKKPFMTSNSEAEAISLSIKSTDVSEVNVMNKDQKVTLSLIIKRSLRVGDRVKYVDNNPKRMHGEAYPGDEGILVNPQSTDPYDWEVKLDKCPNNHHYFRNSQLERIY